MEKKEIYLAKNVIDFEKYIEYKCHEFYLSLDIPEVEDHFFYLNSFANDEEGLEMDLDILFNFDFLLDEDDEDEEEFFIDISDDDPLVSGMSEWLFDD